MHLLALLLTLLFLLKLELKTNIPSRNFTYMMRRIFDILIHFQKDFNLTTGHDRHSHTSNKVPLCSIKCRRHRGILSIEDVDTRFSRPLFDHVLGYLHVWTALYVLFLLIIQLCDFYEKKKKFVNGGTIGGRYNISMANKYL